MRTPQTESLEISASTINRFHLLQGPGRIFLSLIDPGIEVAPKGRYTENPFDPGNKISTVSPGATSMGGLSAW